LYTHIMIILESVSFAFSLFIKLRFLCDVRHSITKNEHLLIWRGRFMMRLYLDCFIVGLCILDIYHVANLNSTPCEIFRDGCVREGCQYGVLDRFNENGEAIILLESVGQEVHIGHSNLPSGSKEGMWFRVTRDKKD